MKPINIGDIFIVKYTSHLKGEHRVKVIEDTRGIIGGGIKVKSLENGQESYVLNEDLYFYSPYAKLIEYGTTIFISVLISTTLWCVFK